MSTIEEQIDSTLMICPYCKDSYQPEGENFHEDEEIEECGTCGAKYYTYQSISIDNVARPDCELNNDKHDYVQSVNFDDLFICSTCGAVK